MEYINNTQISPLISKGVCKVCYVGQDPNRNGTVITKEVAAEMGRKLPGSPVVGFFNKENKDFEGHNRELIIEGGKFEIVDVTKPYGFVPTDADVWFEKFDDEGIEHEYLCTEVYIWTGAYPESKRILEHGNNQSMELDPDTSTGFWTNIDNSTETFFIYNEALIKKLCILGENVEPCFEGAQIKTEFSLENSTEFQELKALVYSMLQDTLSEGGSQDPMENNEVIKAEESIEEVTNFEKQDEEVKEEETPAAEEKSEEEEDEKKPSPNNACGDQDKKKDYELEYNELKSQFDQLQTTYNALVEEVESLREFKLVTDRQNKQSMIDSFYMLTEEDKADVITNIDTYSLDDIEAKLSILCVRNKVNFNLEEQEENPATLFNLNNIETDNTPEWIKAVRNTAHQQ
jgi:hypothetical protein